MQSEPADTSPERSPESALGGFQALMRYRIGDILLVSSLYDLYLFEEDGQLYELIRSEYQGFQLSHTPELSRVGTGAEALARARSARKPDLIITTLHVEDMSAARLARELRAANPSIPIVLLAYDNRGT
jgi:CheY-like chemotaxis protein